MQRRSTMKLAGMTSALLALSACAGGNYRPVADAPVRIGPAYTIRGATYVPAAAPAYDALGYASWYGSESGNRTANGEKFRPGWITAAHTTLPLPTSSCARALAAGGKYSSTYSWPSAWPMPPLTASDRKSTRLNSSH